jgi:hypothetical protein
VPGEAPACESRPCRRAAESTAAPRSSVGQDGRVGTIGERTGVTGAKNAKCFPAPKQRDPVCYRITG